MSTYSELQAQIADELDDQDLLTGGQIAKAIKTAIRFYERKKLYFNYAVGMTFNTVANQEYYGAAANAAIPTLVSPDRLMKATLSGFRYDVTLVPAEMIDASQNGAVLGAPPTSFAYVAQQIRLYGIPNGVYQVTFGGTIRLAELSDDADTNAWTTDAEELTRQAAKRILMSDVTKELPPGSGPTPAESMALTALQKETRLRMGPQTLRADELSAMQGRGGRYNIYTNAPA